MLFCKYTQLWVATAVMCFQCVECSWPGAWVCTIILQAHYPGSLWSVLSPRCDPSNEMVVVTGESPVLPSYHTMGTFMVLEVLQKLLCLKDWLGRESHAHNHIVIHVSSITYWVFHKGLHLLYRHNSCICQLVVKGLGLLLGGKKSLIMGPTFQIQLALDWFFWLKQILS
jgi:hypothetical protein